MALKLQTKPPSAPGIYFFSAKGGSASGGKNKILYIGKANNLKARLSSYFQKNQTSLKTKALLKEASSISWKILGSETEALIKESELIKKYSPKYNILMRDDKQYFFVAFTKGIYPRIFLTHQPTTNYKLSTTNYLGPFTDGGAIKSVLRLLRRTFPYCTCKKPHKNLCLNARIGRCLGYCCTTPTPPSGVRGYQKNIASIKKILSGKNKSLVKTLGKEMKKLSGGQKYEEAGKIRDQIRSLEKIFAHRDVVSRDIITESIKAISSLESLLKTKNIKKIEAYDIANIQGKYAYGSMAVFIDGAPQKDLYRVFKIKTVSSSNDVAMLKEVISRRFKHKEWGYPNVILVDGWKQQLNAVLDAIPLFARRSSSSSSRLRLLRTEGLRLSESNDLGEGRPLTPKIIALTKNKKHVGDHIYISGHAQSIPLSTLPLPLKNLLLHLDSEAHRFAIKHYRKLHRETTLKKIDEI